MKSNYLYLLFICIISCLFVSCSDEDNKGEEIPEWNRFRTTNILVMRTCQSKIYLALVVIKRWRHLSETLFIQWHCWTGRTLSMGKLQS